MGNSKSWSVHKAATLRLFEVMRTAEPDSAAAAFDTLDEATVCSRPVYARFAWFLVNQYVIPEGQKNAGGPLAGSTVIGTLRHLINIGLERFPARKQGTPRGPRDTGDTHHHRRDDQHTITAAALRCPTAHT